MESKKTILFLLNRECSFLPPFLTILDALCDSYNLKVISYEKAGELERLEKIYKNKSVEFLYKKAQENNRTLKGRIAGRLKRMFNLKPTFVKEAEELINNTDYDLLWIIHERTLDQFGDFLKNKKYIVSMYELNDQDQALLKRIEPLLKAASEVIVPEHNRACILKVWTHLQKTPTVVPNKPYNHPLEKRISTQHDDLLKNKKIILYQGYIQRSRNLDAICEACNDLKEYVVVLLGKGDSGYVDELKSKYSKVIHIPFILPPEHLYVTSWAWLAIVKYDYVALNGIFCAPNKIWEYAGFGIPMLGNNIPGLEYTIGHARAGICCDLDNVRQVKEAVLKIAENYDEFSQNALSFYDSFDVKDALCEISARNI